MDRTCAPPLPYRTTATVAREVQASDDDTDSDDAISSDATESDATDSDATDEVGTDGASIFVERERSLPISMALLLRWQVSPPLTLLLLVLGIQHHRHCIRDTVLSRRYTCSITS